MYNKSLSVPREKRDRMRKPVNPMNPEAIKKIIGKKSQIDNVSPPLKTDLADTYITLLAVGMMGAGHNKVLPLAPPFWKLSVWRLEKLPGLVL